jgi:hypothetical protein
MAGPLARLGASVYCLSFFPTRSTEDFFSLAAADASDYVLYFVDEVHLLKPESYHY